MRTLVHAGVACLIALALGVGPASAATADGPIVAQASTAQQTGTLTGTVLDPRGGPMSGATVVVNGNGQNQQQVTDGTGHFSFTLPPGLYDVVVNKGGFQSNSTEAVGVVAGSATNLGINMTEVNLSTLRVIGRTTVSGANTLNSRPTSVTVASGDRLLARENPTLNEVIPELPGVTLGMGTGATPNSNFIVRGSILEARTFIDGHQLSSGVFGEYNTNYAVSTIFNQVEVVKGVGLNGPNSGESPIGTINLRTRDFSNRNTAFIDAGYDSFGGSFYNTYISGNALKNNRLSYVFQKAFQGYQGPTFGYIGNRVGTNPSSTYNLNDSGALNALIQWQGDFSYPHTNVGDLGKIRYRLSDATSITAQYLGLFGVYAPQGGSYASYNGNRVLSQCYNGTTPANGSGCTLTSVYNPPYVANENLIGQNVPVYSWFPNSIVQNNEPYFSAEFKTSFKNDTILIRPYTAIINRFISGANENNYPGNNGGWYQVTSAANCQTTFVAPTATGGAKGPCFSQNMTYNTTTAFVNPGGPPAKFLTINTPLACSPAAPCYTTPTAIENDGLIGYGTPFSQPELDRLHGVTFQYLHPAGDNLFGFSYDYTSDDTYKLSGDTTTPPAGCTPTLFGGPNTPTISVNQVQNGVVTPVTVNNIGYQPNCTLGLAQGAAPFLPRTGINIPPTIIRKNDFALTGLLQVTPQLQAQVGLYYTGWRANYQIEDPNVLATFTNALQGNEAPVALIGQVRSLSHFDPQVALSYRASRDLSLRLSGGSGITVPYAGLISGFPNVDLPNGANNLIYTLSPPNPLLQPETTVAYDAGFDLRMHDGGILSVDAFDNTVHNVFVSNIIPSTTANPVPGCPATAIGGCQFSETINGPIARDYGLEVTFNKSVPYGFGYTLTSTFERAFLDQLPPSIYLPASGSNLINGKQFDGNGSAIVPYFKAYGELRYGWQGGGLLSFGADTVGSNNWYYFPTAVTTFNASYRQPIGNRYRLQLAVDNLTNFNTGTFFGQATFNNGITRSRISTFSGQPVYLAGSTTSVQIVQPRTFRLSLQRNFDY